MKRPTIKEYIPDKEELAAMRRYQKIPTEKKLQMLDNYREFMFEIWRCNPELREQYEKSRQIC
jgi:hypothetical protein